MYLRWPCRLSCSLGPFPFVIWEIWNWLVAVEICIMWLNRTSGVRGDTSCHNLVLPRTIPIYASPFTQYSWRLSTTVYRPIVIDLGFIFCIRRDLVRMLGSTYGPNNPPLTSSSGWRIRTRDLQLWYHMLGSSSGPLYQNPQVVIEAYSILFIQFIKWMDQRHWKGSDEDAGLYIWTQQSERLMYFSLLFMIVDVNL